MEIKFKLKELLYSLLVRGDIYNQIFALEEERAIKFCMKVEDESNINSMVLDELKGWFQQVSSQRNNQHIHSVITHFRNLCRYIQSEYRQNYMVEDPEIIEFLSIMAQIYKEKESLKDVKAFEKIKNDLNSLLMGDSISITDIDFKESAIYFDNFEPKNNCPELISQKLRQYKNQFEVEKIQPNSNDTFLIQRLSEEHNFIYLTKNDNSETNSNEEGSADKNQSQEEESEDENDDVQEIILIRKNNTAKQYRRTLAEIASMIQEDQCDRYREFDESESEIFEKILYLINEFQFDERVFKKYDILLQIQENSVDIFGSQDGEQIVEDLIKEVKLNQQFRIKSVNREKSQIEEVKEDIQAENEKFKSDIKKLSLLGIELEVYPQIVIPDLAEVPNNEIVKTSLITFLHSLKQEQIYDDIFKEKCQIIKCDNAFSEIQMNYLKKYNIIQNQCLEGIKLQCTEYKYNLFLSSFNEFKDNMLIKRELHVEQILYKMLLKNKRNKINELHSKFQYTIINEQQDDLSAQNQISLICSIKDKEVLVKELEQLIKEIKNDVAEVDYKLTESDLELFSEKGDELIQDICRKQQLEDEANKSDGEEDMKKKIEKSQIYLQYYLADTIFEFRNNLIDLQRERENQTYKNFKLTLQQSQITSNIPSNGETNLQVSSSKETLKQFKSEIAIQLTTTENFESEINRIVKGQTAPSLILLDHSEEDHSKYFSTLFNKDDKFKYTLMNSSSAGENMNSNSQQNDIKFDEIKKELSHIPQEQVCISITMREKHISHSKKEDGGDAGVVNSLVFVGQNLIEQFTREFNSEKLDEIQSDFLIHAIIEALCQGKQIQLFIKNENLREKIVDILLMALERCALKDISNKNNVIKIFFKKISRKRKSIFEGKEKGRNQIQQQVDEDRKAEEDIHKILQKFKDHQQNHKQKTQEQKEISLKNSWYFYINDHKGKEFNGHTSTIIDSLYRQFIKNRQNGQNIDSPEEYKFINVFKQDFEEKSEKQQSQDDSSEMEEERGVIFNFANEEVEFAYFNVIVSFQWFFKHYKQLEDIILSMKNIFKNSDINEISMTATKDTIDRGIKKLLFEEEIYSVQFKEEKYLLTNLSNKKGFQINRQSLVYDAQDNSNEAKTKTENVIFNYDFSRQEVDSSQEMYSLKLLVEKKDKQKVQDNLKLFFQIRKKHYDKAQMILQDKIKKENSLKFFYYTPKLQKFYMKSIKGNNYEILDQCTNQCFYLITSTKSRTSIQNFETETKRLKAFYEENWSELMEDMKKRLQVLNEERGEAEEYVISQLSNRHVTLLSSLKEWEIDQYKSNFFMVNSKNFINYIKSDIKYRIIYTIPDKDSPFIMIPKFFYRDPSTINNLKENVQESFAKLKQKISSYQKPKEEINVLIFLSQTYTVELDSVPLFYLQFYKN